MQKKVCQTSFFFDFLFFLFFCISEKVTGFPFWAETGVVKVRKLLKSRRVPPPGSVWVSQGQASPGTLGSGCPAVLAMPPGGSGPPTWAPGPSAGTRAESVFAIVLGVGSAKLLRARADRTHGFALRAQLQSPDRISHAKEFTRDGYTASHE